MSDEPELAVVIAADRYATVRRTVRYLRAQTARDRLEVVLVVGTRDGLEAHEPELGDFGATKIVEADVLASLASARVAGIRATSAPLIALGETHSFPEPGWAAALIEAHQGPYAVVGPVVQNANPEFARSWGSLYVDYGPWLAPHPGGRMDDVPGHNSAYKRSVLRRHDPILERLFAAEWNLHQRIRAGGEDLYLDPRARIDHLNMTRLVPAALQWFHFSRGFASARARGWSPLRRAIYALGGPYTFALRLSRVVADIRRTGRLALMPGALPMMLAVLGASTLGELAGYATGTGQAERRICKYELFRERYARETPGTDGARRGSPEARRTAT